MSLGSGSEFRAGIYILGLGLSLKSLFRVKNSGRDSGQNLGLEYSVKNLTCPHFIFDQLRKTILFKNPIHISTWVCLKLVPCTVYRSKKKLSYMRKKSRPRMSWMRKRENKIGKGFNLWQQGGKLSVWLEQKVSLL